MQASIEGLEPFWRALRACVDALARARQHYAGIFDFLPVAAAITDNQASIQEANLAMAELVGRAPRRLVGKPLLLLVAREDWPCFLIHLVQGTPSSRVSLDTAGGKVPVEFSIKAMRSAGLCWFARRID